MTLTEAQKIIAKDNHRFRVVNCGRRTGKTYLSVLEMITKSVSKKDQNIAYIATTFQQARDIAWQELKKIAHPAISSVNEGRLEVIVKSQDNGTSKITLRGWESIETMRGQKFDFLVIDEIASMRNFWTNWQEVIRPTLTDTKGQVLFISTPKGFNHFYDLYNLEATDNDYKSFHFTSYDNPYIPKEEIDKAREELTEDRFAQEYLADFRKTEGLVYKEFSREKHLFDYEDENIFNAKVRDTVVGVDFGFTNPCAILTIKIDLEGKYWLTNEIYKSGMTDTEIAEYVSGLKANRVYPDPESPSAIEQMKRLGINVREVVKNKDSIVNGITRVRELLKADKLKIHKSCLNTIMEFETYSYPDKKDGMNDKELPIKSNDHAMDALRYALYMVESSQIKPQVAQIYRPAIRY